MCQGFIFYDCMIMADLKWQEPASALNSSAYLTDIDKNYFNVIQCKTCKTKFK